MMKSVILLLLFSSHVWAAPLCEVYGISDSPQSLNCSFIRQPLSLTCDKGIYFINGEKVDIAFHMEVEDGPVPLVFRTSKSELTVVMQTGSLHKATLLRGRKSVRGQCRS